MNLISATVFEGGESVSDDNEVTMSSWTVEEVKRVITDMYGEEWADESIEFLDDGPATCGESIEIVNKNLAQAIKCGSEGGMIYVVRS